MKSSIFATTALVLSAGVAAADVAVSGDGRMGLLRDFGATDTSFTSRLRINFTASGQSDGGLSFGGSIRADNAAAACTTPGVGAGDVAQLAANPTAAQQAIITRAANASAAVLANGGTQAQADAAAAAILNEIRLGASTCAGGGVNGVAGSVFISGDFGRITMGDTNGAAKAAVGDVGGAGLTNLGDLNDATYLSNPAAMRPTARYDYTVAGFGVHLSVSNPTATRTNPLGTNPAIPFRNTVSSIAFTYNMDGLKLGLGYETTGNLNHTILGGSYTIAGVTLAANYGELTGAGPKLTQTSASAAYTADALTVSAFYSDNRIRNAITTTPNTIAYGLGGQYDLGGGASLRGGWVQNVSSRRNAVDFGVNFAF